ncbi:hypothetical protein F4810DRAFT_707123 [Camillea tinctor]|nr:hypothetical protein F4810DRAFT_707123 [Camillea tinctor]
MERFHDLPVSDRDSVDEPFLPQKEKGKTVSINEYKKLRRLLYYSGFIIVSLTVACIILAVKLEHTGYTPFFAERVYSPVEDIIRYENVVFSTGFGHERTEYQGPPTPERDALWDDLYGFGISRIPRESASKLVNKTVPIPGEPGQYVIQLNVFHQLHCLNMIRKSLYSDVEYPPDHELMGIEHIEHCYDALRQSLMCSADVTPLPWQWVEEVQEAKEVARVAHTCRDFEAVRTWAKENAVIHFDRKTYVPDDLQGH